LASTNRIPSFIRSFCSSGKTSDRAVGSPAIEALATGEFIRRGDNLVIAGQSGVGKSRIVQSVGRAACSQG
jgi:DNA replication protein DnaC